MEGLKLYLEEVRKVKIPFGIEYINFYREFLKTGGYRFLRVDSNNGKLHMVRTKRSRKRFPRHHIEIEKQERVIIIELHFDYKEPLHLKGIKCSEDDSEVVKKEARRIRKIFERELKKEKEIR